MKPRNNSRSLTRVNLTFPTDLLEEVGSLVPPRRRNEFIVEATSAAVRRRRLEDVVARLRSEAAWSDADHPDLTSDGDIVAAVERLRGDWHGRIDESDNAASGDNE